MKDISLVINEDYQLEPESALDFYICNNTIRNLKNYNNLKIN